MPIHFGITYGEIVTSSAIELVSLRDGDIQRGLNGSFHSQLQP